MNNVQRMGSTRRPLLNRALAAAGARVAGALALAACACLVASLGDDGPAPPWRRPAEAGLRGPPPALLGLHACSLALRHPFRAPYSRNAAPRASTLSPSTPLAVLPRHPTGAGAVCLVAGDALAWEAAVGALMAALAGPPRRGALVATSTTPCPLAPDHTLLLSTGAPPPPPPAHASCTAHPDSGDLLAWGRVVVSRAGRAGVAASVACIPHGTPPALALTARNATALCEAAVAVGAGLAQLGVPTHRGGAAGGFTTADKLRAASFTSAAASAALSLRAGRVPPGQACPRRLEASLACAGGGAAVAWATLAHPPGLSTAGATLATAALLLIRRSATPILLRT